MNNDFAVIESESLFSFDYWPMDYKDEWPQEGEAKVYVDVGMPEPDVGIPFSLSYHYFIGGVDYTNQLSNKAHKEVLKQALEEFQKWRETGLLP